DRAEAADRAKANFLAVTSHELRNPLSNVLGFAGLLLDEVSGPLNETQRREVELLQDNARLLRRLAEDIADYLRLDGHRLRPQVEPVDLCAVGRRVAAGAAPRAMDAGLHLETRIPSGSIVAAADARRVEQVLHNLLDNAIKYTEAGRVDLRVARDGPQVITEVADTGPGIPAHQRDAIFEPFHRLPGRGRRADGVGLGLAISRGLARAMGGELTVSSAVGRGSRFTLRLPAWGDGSL
ncbi:MAG: sensor histidine kinase, partial [Deltaproteobacteria bacterium]